jgi:subtilisin-like proprotein convertase family protein
MESLFGNAPAIIEKAAKNRLGILALMIIALGVIASVFFANSSELVKLIVFMTLFLGVVGYTISALQTIKEEKKKSQFTWTEEDVPQREKFAEREQVEISGLKYFQIESKVNKPDAAIPDNTPIGLSNTIGMSMHGVVKDISVGWRVKHTYAGDLVVKLISPSGKEITLFDRERGAKSMGDKLESHTVLDTPALKEIVGEQIFGDWTINVSDLSAGDIGELVEWGIKVALG